MHVKYAVLQRSYSAPVRVSDTAAVFAVAAARAVWALAGRDDTVWRAVAVVWGVAAREDTPCTVFDAALVFVGLTARPAVARTDARDAVAGASTV